MHGRGGSSGDTLTRYLLNNPNILDEQDPATGRAPLAIAAVAGFADEVEQLLQKGAKADALSRNGETALLLITQETSRESAQDCPAPPQQDARGLLHQTARQGWGYGLTAEQMAIASSDKAVARALNPEKKPSIFAKLASVVGSVLLYTVAWVNKTAKGVVRRLFRLNPKLDEKSTSPAVNTGETPNKEEFVENVDNFVKENPTLERFFKGNPNYIQELAKKATELKDDPSTPLGQPDLLPKTIKVTLHQQVIYCDDSSSMKCEGRWAAQVRLVQKIAQITTRILPEGDGVALRFINQNVDNSEKLNIQEIGTIMDNMSWQRNGNTVIGTYLRSKILELLVYSKLQPPTLARPLLISVVTDGMPSQEKDEAFAEAIKECGDKLKQAGYPRESVKFMIGQIGTGKAAAAFLEGVGKNRDIADMVFVTSDQLDERVSAFKANEGDLDRWLIETLYSPIKN
ncbi:hypothetical protein B0H14DRAFT_2900454 [Mycena olivaceomarginata]|nr:hypothetical protein B0H14DRAFT_2900454 [Mycena olivaceomarginata]